MRKPSHGKEGNPTLKGCRKIGELPISENTLFVLSQKVRNPPQKVNPYHFKNVKKRLTYDDYCNLQFVRTLGEGEYLLIPIGISIFSTSKNPRGLGKIVMNIQVYREGSFRTYKLTYIKSGFVKFIRERLYLSSDARSFQSHA